MDLFASVSSSIDIFFLIIALFLIPSITLSPTATTPPHLPPTPSIDAFSPPSTPMTPHTPHGHSASHLGVPGVPSITITPEPPFHSSSRPRSGSGTRRMLGKWAHKRKSVSFSLSSIDDIALPPSAAASPNKRRPPTPFVKGGLKSPSPSPGGSPMPSPGMKSPRSPRSPGSVGSMGGSVPGTPMPGMPENGGVGDVMLHRKEMEDPMGVKKQWLMA
ncbi:hypothetical protein IAT38_001481 [Cryptococcus sp. DSM 104549]